MPPKTITGDDMKNTVLIVDDNVVMSVFLERNITRSAPDLQVIRARNAKQAEEMFREHYPDLKAVIMNGSLSGSGECDTVPIVECMQQQVPGLKIIAFSVIQENLKLLQAAGCQHAVLNNGGQAMVAKLVAHLQ